MSDLFTILFLLGSSIIVAVAIWALSRKRNPFKIPSKLPAEWRTQLELNVHFYQNLEGKRKRKFEKKVLRFLRNVRVTGIRLEVEDIDRLLVASSAVIPIFNFPNWEYAYLHEVLLYPDHFDRNFSTEKPEEVISGMVGSGRNMEGVMILNRNSLHQGFANAKDKKNVGLHEFAHILDKEDGAVDGVPTILNEEEYIKPWLSLMHKHMKKIKQGKSSINEYAATGEEEFFAVASEYFFESPKILKKKHPQLYKMLSKAYRMDLAKWLTAPFKKKKRIGRNDPCPCGSGEKYKYCCLK